MLIYKNIKLYYLLGNKKYCKIVLLIIKDNFKLDKNLFF